MVDVKENIVEFSTLDNRIQTILQKALEVRKYSYCPYSTFKVGACVETIDGDLFTGCNVENASFTVGTCAERCAYVKAISEGKKKFKAVAIVAFSEDSFVSPCGACRQFMMEFGNVDVYLGNPDLKKIHVTSTKEMLPLAFISFKKDIK